MCVCLGGWVSACVGKEGKLTERAQRPQVMGENVLLMETGDILLKFTANLNLLGHNLSSWRKETPFTWELLFRSNKWVTGKRSQCQRADGGAYYRVIRAVLSKGKNMSLSFPNWLNHNMDVENIAEHYFVHCNYTDKTIYEALLTQQFKCCFQPTQGIWRSPWSPIWSLILIPSSWSWLTAHTIKKKIP